MNISFEISSILISFILLVYFGKAKRLKSYQNTLFFAIIILNIISSIVDIGNAYMFKYRPDLTYLMSIDSLVFYVTHFLVVPTLFVYMLSIVQDWSELNVVNKTMTVAPAVVVLTIILLNPFTHFVFSYETGVYERGIGLYFLYAGTAYYVGIAIIILIAKRKLFPAQKRFAILLSYIIMILSVFIQYIKFNVRVETFAITYSSLVILMMVCNPMDLVDRETELFNKAAFDTMLRITLARKRYTDFICVAVMDNTKNYSDIDASLQSAAMQYASFFNDLWENSVVYRIEDDIYVLEVNNADEQAVEEIINSIERRFDKNWVLSNGEGISGAVRICRLEIPEDLDSRDKFYAIVADMVARQDYSGHLSSKDFEVEDIARKKKVNNALMRAVEKGSIEMAYTPIYSMEKRKVEGVEVSSKFLDSELGFVYENDILEFAEKTGMFYGLAEDLFKKTIDFVCSDVAKENGIEFVAIRLSSVSCIQNSMFKRFAEYVSQKKVKPSQVVFMISEYTLSKAPGSLEDAMNEAHDMGFRFCIDDYGSGYTNIESIYALPFDTVKMSRSVTKAATTNVKAAISMEGVMGTFRDLSIKNTVDGINDEEELLILKDLPCEYAMGQLFTENLDIKRLVESVKELNEWKGGFEIGS